MACRVVCDVVQRLVLHCLTGPYSGYYVTGMVFNLTSALESLELCELGAKVVQTPTLLCCCAVCVLSVCCCVVCVVPCLCRCSSVAMAECPLSGPPAVHGSVWSTRGVAIMQAALRLPPLCLHALGLRFLHATPHPAFVQRSTCTIPPPPLSLMVCGWSSLALCAGGCD